MILSGSKRIAQLTGPDCFVLALSHMMRVNGQQGLVGQTHVVMEEVPDIASLREGSRRLGEAYPILNAFVRRSPFTLLPDWCTDPRDRRILTVQLWHEEGVESWPTGSYSTASAQQLAENLLNTPIEECGGLRNLRLDLVILKEGGSALILTWNHLLFDGKGAELLVGTLFDAVNGRIPDPFQPIKKEHIPISVQFSRSRPAVNRFFELMMHRYQSLSGKKPISGRLRFKVVSFTTHESALIRAHAEKLSGLFPLSFYLACATRAHREAFLSRGEDPDLYVSSIPVQLRRKWAGANPFQNRVTVLFFSMKKEHLSSMMDAVKAAHLQFEELTRKDLGSSFSMILRLMRRLPSYVYMKFLGTQFSGDITSFFHSATGSFAVNLSELAGSAVRDAYHVPSVSAPPGSGLFFGECHGRITATFSWREGAVTEHEADLILRRMWEDLTGQTPLPTK
jgi:hypothetical protein